MSMSNISLWGRAWKLTVKYLSGEDVQTKGGSLSGICRS